MLKAMEGICKPQFVIYKFLEETFLLVWFSLKSAGFLGKKWDVLSEKNFLPQNWTRIEQILIWIFFWETGILVTRICNVDTSTNVELYLSMYANHTLCETTKKAIIVKCKVIFGEE